MSSYYACQHCLSNHSRASISITGIILELLFSNISGGLYKTALSLKCPVVGYTPESQNLKKREAEVD